jgi:deoxyadenosine/deoxycytidine kinase
MPIISIAGNIGVGKSTLLKRLESMGHTVMFEGINRGAWGGLLKKYYDDPKKYAYLFQTTSEKVRVPLPDDGASRHGRTMERTVTRKAWRQNCVH